MSVIVLPHEVALFDFRDTSACFEKSGLNGIASVYIYAEDAKPEALEKTSTEDVIEKAPEKAGDTEIPCTNGNDDKGKKAVGAEAQTMEAGGNSAGKVPVDDDDDDEVWFDVVIIERVLIV